MILSYDDPMARKNSKTQTKKWTCRRWSLRHLHRLGQKVCQRLGHFLCPGGDEGIITSILNAGDGEDAGPCLIPINYIRVKPYWPASIIYQVWTFDMGYFDKSRHGRQAPSVEKVPLPHFPWPKLMQVSLKLWSLNEWRTGKVVDPCRPVSVEVVRWRLKSWSKQFDWMIYVGWNYLKGDRILIFHHSNLYSTIKISWPSRVFFTSSSRVQWKHGCALKTIWVHGVIVLMGGRTLPKPKCYLIEIVVYFCDSWSSFRISLLGPNNLHSEKLPGTWLSM